MNMKKLHIFLALAAACLASCNKNEVPFYAANSDGIYFDYDPDDENSFETSVNFANYIVEDPEYLTVPVKLKTLGYLSEQDRRVVLKAEAVDSYELAEVEIPEIVVPAGETEIEVEVKALRPAQTNTTYAVHLSVDGESSESQIGSGVTEQSGFTIYVEDSYSQPAAWVNVSYYYGEWTAEKHILLAKVTGINNFYENGSMGEMYNTMAVDSLRTYYAENPDAEKVVEIPIINLSGWNGTYEQPYYWGELQDRYMGPYNMTVFCYYCNAFGINTSNEADEFASTEENMAEVNKKAVNAMMSYYNQQYQMGSSLAYASQQFSVPMLSELMGEYEIVEPYWWVNVPSTTPPGGTPTGIFIEDYYGEYSEAKYRFMIETLAEALGDSFTLTYMFPVCSDYMGGNTWDSSLSPYWDYNEAAQIAKQRIQECHDLFLEKLNENPGAYDFTFPATITFPDDSQGGGKDDK